MQVLHGFQVGQSDIRSINNATLIFGSDYPEVVVILLTAAGDLLLSGSSGVGIVNVLGV